MKNTNKDLLKVVNRMCRLVNEMNDTHSDLMYDIDIDIINSNHAIIAIHHANIDFKHRYIASTIKQWLRFNSKEIHHSFKDFLRFDRLYIYEDYSIQYYEFNGSGLE